jgi:hypothetical protein
MSSSLTQKFPTGRVIKFVEMAGVHVRENFLYVIFLFVYVTFFILLLLFYLDYALPHIYDCATLHHPTVCGTAP